MATGIHQAAMFARGRLIPALGAQQNDMSGFETMSDTIGAILCGLIIASPFIVEIFKGF
jgi:hypothetical protein